MLVGTELVGTELVGTELVGTELVGTERVGGELVVVGSVVVRSGRVTLVPVGAAARGAARCVVAGAARLRAAAALADVVPRSPPGVAFADGALAAAIAAPPPPPVLADELAAAVELWTVDASARRVVAVVEEEI